MGVLRLVHDVLDGQLVDRKHQKIGRIDALALELRDGKPPRVAAVLTGGPVRDRRVGRPMIWLGRALRALGRVERGGESRVSFDRVRRIDECIHLDVDGDALEAMHVERWLAERVVCRIPGAAEKDGQKAKGGKK